MPSHENSDRYALGMVIYGILSGRIPFYSYPDLLAVAKVVKSKRPVKPQGRAGCGSRAVFGMYWGVAGSPVHVTARVSKLCFIIWRKLGGLE